VTANRAWFTEQARERALTVETDGNGNLFAWWGDPTRGDAVLTGGRLDPAPGSDSDCSLGVVSGLLAVDVLRERGIVPHRPVGVAAFVDGAGARFGVPNLGARLFTGAIDVDAAMALRDRDGVSLAAMMAASGLDPARAGADPRRLARVGAFVGVEIEPGWHLARAGSPVGVVTAAWPHQRLRLDVTGATDRAGAHDQTRTDPMLLGAFTVLAANKEARHHGAVAAVGRIAAHPDAPDTVAELVSVWLDVGAPDQSTLDSLEAAVRRRVAERAQRDRVSVRWTVEVRQPPASFDPALTRRLAAAGAAAPTLTTAAGRDAAVLATRLPTALLYVRAAAEASPRSGDRVTDADRAVGVTALAEIMADLVGSAHA
jgi:N-carbamoyl-L-amino-acid hydrolase